MGRTLYLECKSGISGDMVVGALIDLGVSTERLGKALASLPLEGYEVRVSTRELRGIAACDFDVVMDEEHENHDHDMDWLYGAHDEHDHHHEHAHDHDHEHAHDHDHEHAHDHDHEHEHDHDHEHGHEHEHAHGHEHGHEHEHGHGHHEHRSLADVRAIVEAAALTERAKRIAMRIFQILAEAEAKAHGKPVSEVHFHEVGAVDSIVDIVAAAFCLDELDITAAAISPLAEGTGQVRCAHGWLPVPVPAVANICAAHGLPLAIGEREGEFVTPTGAAIAAAIRTMDALPQGCVIRAVGVGSGKRAYNPPSMVRAMIIEDAAPAPEPAVVAGGSQAPAGFSLEEPHLWKLETEMDDCTGEALAHALSLLLEAGAAEAHYLPVVMKKGRPGYQLEVLCSADKIAELEELIFENTTTIGIRRMPLWRTALAREAVTLETPFGSVRAKQVTLPSGEKRSYPEYESVAELAREAGVSYQKAFSLAVAAAKGR